MISLWASCWRERAVEKKTKILQKSFFFDMLAPLIALSTPKDYHDNGPACQVRNGQEV